jgi:hypothetical protein
MSNEPEKLNMGCLSVFWTGLKGFFYISLLFLVVFVIGIFGIWFFFFYMNFLLSSPLWLTMIGLAIPIIIFIGYYTRLLQWSFGTYLKLEENKEQE